MEVKNLSFIRMLLDNVEYCRSIRVTQSVGKTPGDKGKTRVDFLFQDDCDTITWKFRTEEYVKFYSQYIPKEKIQK